MFCSFESLRDELKHGLRRGSAAGVSAPRSGGGGGGGGGGGLPLASSPLTMLGFWRIILDEAQVVSNTNSAAALMASALWRRHAWVVTGTPVDQHVERAVLVPCHLGGATARRPGRMGRRACGAVGCTTDGVMTGR